MLDQKYVTVIKKIKGRVKQQNGEDRRNSELENKTLELHNLNNRE